MARVTDEPVVIARRFNGPPGSGHGGYSAGLRRARWSTRRRPR